MIGITHRRISRVSGEFVHGIQERAYRDSQAGQELRQLRLVWVVAVICFLVFLPLDFLAGAQADRPWLLAWRSAIVAIGLAVILCLRDSPSSGRRDALTSIALVLVMASYGLLLTGRTRLPGTGGALLLLLVGSYMFSPARFWLACLRGALGSTLSAVLYWWRAGEPGSAALDFSFLLPANLLAGLALAQVNRSRRRLFLQRQRLRAELVRRRSDQAQLKELHARNLRLLHNALPARIAAQLCANPHRRPARSHREAVVVFADIVGFTGLAQTRSALRLLVMLNQLFGQFDTLAAEHQVEKIKTVGDAYLAVAGLDADPQMAPERAARMALSLQRAARGVGRRHRAEIELRIGIHRGPLVAGVIGNARYAFDVWGQAVNIASRLETAAAPGRILVSDSVRQGCPDSLLFGSPQVLELRGCGHITASALYGEA